MKKLFILMIILLINVNIVNISAQVPKIVPYVNDFANVLNENEELQLNLLLDNIEKNTTWEIAIVSVKNTEGDSRVNYANKIGDENGVGKKDKDNGIVVLWSLDNEKGGAIATGRYSESIFNDAKVGRIGRDSRAYFDKGEYYNGFNFIIEELKKEIDTPIYLNQTLPNEQGPTSPMSFGLLLFIIIVLVLFFTISIIPSVGSGYSSSSSSGSGVRISTGSFSGGRSSGGGFSSGRGFGGGSFGGGGAGF